MKISEFTVFGERCSGTNWLQKSVESSTGLQVTWRYGWKHFPGFEDLSGSDNCLFLCIVRNPYDWLGSLFSCPHHVAMHLRKDFSTFLTDEYYSWHDAPKHVEEKVFGTEIMEDRHIIEKRRYKNILELRNVKNRYLLETLPRNIKNFYVVNYDIMKMQHAVTMVNISRTFNLPIIHNTDAVSLDAKRGGAFQNKKYLVEDKHLEIINSGLDWELESLLRFKKRHAATSSSD